MTGFRVPMCADCGHALGDHRTVANGLHVTNGICLYPGCGCRAYKPENRDAGEPHTPAAAA